jgi:hypothetical protein
MGQGKQQNQQNQQEGWQSGQNAGQSQEEQGGFLDGLGKMAGLAISGTRFGRNIAEVQSNDLQNDLKVLQTMMTNPSANPQDLQQLGRKIISNSPRLQGVVSKMEFVAGQNSAKATDPAELANKYSSGLKNLIDAGVTGPIIQGFINKIVEVGGLISGEATVTPTKKNVINVGKDTSIYDPDTKEFFQAPSSPNKPQMKQYYKNDDPSQSQYFDSLNTPEGWTAKDPTKAANVEAGTQKIQSETELNKKKGELYDTSIALQNAPAPTETKTDNRGLFSTFDNAYSTLKKWKGDTETKPLDSYFQAATPTVPTDNTPKTFQQTGINQPDEQQILQEMQDAIPEFDLKQEYQNDTAGMQRIMKLWKEKKINKSVLNQMFVKQKAQQALGQTN